jgi:hypothetical protein
MGDEANSQKALKEAGKYNNIYLTKEWF